MERRPHPTDRRSKLVAATPEGRGSPTGPTASWTQPPEVLRDLTPTELETLAGILAGVDAAAVS